MEHAALAGPVTPTRSNGSPSNGSPINGKTGQTGQGGPFALAPSSRRQLIAAACGGAIGAIAAAPVLTPLETVASAVLCATMAAIAVEDALRFRVPDPWVYSALVSGLVWTAFVRIRSDDSALMAIGLAVLPAAACGGAFLAVREIFFRLRGTDGLGLGDVKLAAAGGAWLGWEAFAFAVVVAAVGALAFVGTSVLRGRAWQASRKLAFGAFLAPALWATWFVWRLAGNG